jgi:hypothetical protein
MTNEKDSRPVVYCYVDPAFPWDASAVSGEAERRGFRVVRGDNADELLFLMQMGRPAAVVYALASPEARTYGSFHMISQRALDMLVPMVVVGPEDPRDGLLLRYPVGRTIEERYVPLHAVGDLFEEFDAVPPTTPSRPAPFVQGQTLGKGRTMMTWRRSLPPAAAPRVSSVPSEPPTPLETEPTEPDEPTELYEGAAPAAGPDPGLLRHSEPAPPAPSIAPKPRPWKVLAVVAGGVAIGVAALWVYVATAPETAQRAREAAEPVALAATAPRIAEPADLAVAAPEIAVPAERPAERDASVEAPPPLPPERAAASAKPPEALLSGASGAIRFPGHFKDETAMFFFEGHEEEWRFLELVRSLGPSTVIRLTGHATFDELSTGPEKLARGRAWAVEKYLVRRGIPKERLLSEGGPPVRPGSDPDPHGKSRSRWVDVRFE